MCGFLSEREKIFVAFLMTSVFLYNCTIGVAGHMDILKLMMRRVVNPNQLACTVFTLGYFEDSQIMYMTPVWYAALVGNMTILKVYYLFINICSSIYKHQMKYYTVIDWSCEVYMLYGSPQRFIYIYKIPRELYIF